MNRGRKEAGVFLQKSSNMNRLLPAIFLLLAGAIAISSYLYYQKQKKAVMQEQTTQLKAIVDLKAIQIQNWLRERTGDARLIQQNPIMVAELAAFLGDRSKETRRISIQRWLVSLQRNYDYENVMLLDRRGEVILSANPHHTTIGSEGINTIETALRNRETTLSDLHSNPKVPHIHLDLVVPVLVGNEIVGCVFLRIDPSVFLFPMIQSWPTPSPSAETLLVKREGENVLFLNELRHRQGAAMTLRIPLHNMDLPAALAVLGKTGVTAGYDYRGIAVRSVSRSIPDTPWFIVAKIDKEEITSPLRRSAQIIFSIALALIIATALVVLTLWRYQAARFQQRQLETENQRLALAQHFDYLTRYANDIILLSDEKWQILEANERAMLAYGRNREELLKMNLRDLRVPDERNKLAAEYKQTEEMLGAIFETWHMKKDGSIFPVEVSARVIAIDGKKYYQSIIHNISERKQAENALRESEEKFKQVFETANVGKSITQLNGEINVNQAFCDMLGYSREELQKTKWQELTPANEIASTQKMLEPLLQGRQNTARFNKRYVQKNGSTVWGDVSVAIKRDAAGKPLHFITTVVDISERKKAEEEIESARAFLEMIINMSPFAMWISNAEGTVIRVNRSLCETIHLTQDQIEGKYNVLNDENLEKQGVMPQVKAVFARHEPARFSIPWMAAGAGSIDFKEAHNMHIDVSMFPIANAQGELVNVVCQWIDISERKLAEKALHESEAKFRQTFEFSPVGIVMVGLDKRFIGSNKAFSESLGYAPEELVGKTIADFTHPADILIGMDEMKAIARGDLAISQVQKRYLHKDGRTIWGEATISLIRDQNANPKYFLAIIQNISKRKQAEDALRESERKFRETVVTLDEGYYSVTLDGKLLEHNQAFNRILGFAIHEDLKGIQLPDFWQDPDQRKEYLMAFAASGSISNYQIEAKTQKGDKITILASAHLVKEENGRPQRIEGVFLDISGRMRDEVEIRRLNEELEQRVLQRTAQLEAANKELEAFSYSVSHDLRAPLRAIDGFSRIVLEDYSPKLDDEGRRLLNVIAGNTGKMGHLIDDLLAFSRLSRQQITFAAVDMAALAETIFSELKNLEKGRKIEFKVGVLPISYGDHSMLYHVLLNLLSNALKFTRPKAKARIEFGGRTAIGETVYYVKDNGVGFDMAYADKLFGVFQRLHGTDEFEGTGVGLAIVQRIVLRHGGRVWAESEGGKGATFYFSLPTDQGLGSRVEGIEKKELRE